MVCEHGTVIWRADILRPLAEHDKQRFLQWLADPAAPLGDSWKRTHMPLSVSAFSGAGSARRACLTYGRFRHRAGGASDAGHRC